MTSENFSPVYCEHGNISFACILCRQKQKTASARGRYKPVKTVEKPTTLCKFSERGLCMGTIKEKEALRGTICCPFCLLFRPNSCVL